MYGKCRGCKQVELLKSPLQIVMVQPPKEKNLLTPVNKPDVKTDPDTHELILMAGLVRVKLSFQRYLCCVRKSNRSVPIAKGLPKSRNQTSSTLIKIRPF